MKPKVSIHKTETKTVEMTMDKAELEEALRLYLVRYHAEFRNMIINFSFAPDQQVTITATRAKETDR